MKPARLLAAAMVTLTSLPLMAQQTDTAVEQSAAARSVTNPMNGPSGAPAGSAVSAPKQMRPVVAILMGSLDSKSAKVGGEVELRTQAAMATADGTPIPKGMRIMGRLIAVEAHRKGGPDGEVAIQFDRAEMKGGQRLAIVAEILWVAPPPSSSTADMLRSQNDIGGGVMGGATQVMGGAKNGGLGTGTSSVLTVSGGRVQVTSMTSQGLSSVADYGVKAPDQPSGGPGIATAIAGEKLAHPTGVAGVMLAADASGEVSGTFTAAGQNVHLDGGTQVVLELAAAQ
jgi:hypothetical protein